MAELKIKIASANKERKIFLREIRKAVINFTGERMKLDAIIHEIVKNIYDHANGNGYLHLTKNGNFIDFIIGNDFSTPPGLDLNVKRSEGKNFGVGLQLIEEISKALDIDLKIDMQKSFVYSGKYRLTPTQK